MRSVRILGVLVVLVGVAAAVIAVAPAVQGQIVARQTDRGPRVFQFDGLAGNVEIGASVRDLDSADVSREKLAADAAGAVIDGVDSDGAAATAGMRAGDVVVEYDGEKVRSARHLIRLVRESRPDRAVKMTVSRGGARTELTITPRPARERTFTFNAPEMRESLRGLRDLGQEFGDLGRNFSFDFEGFPRGVRGRLGVTIQELTPQLAEYFGVKDGVLVTAVTDGSPASKAGFKAGDVITAINTRSVGTSRDLMRELQDVENGKEVSIAVTRDRKPMTLKATLEDRPMRRLRTTVRGV